MTYEGDILTGYAAFAGAALMDFALERRIMQTVYLLTLPAALERFGDLFAWGTTYESSSEKSEAMNERPDI